MTNTSVEFSSFDWLKVPPRFRGKSFENYNYKTSGDAPERSIMVMLRSKKGIFLTGPVGSGKTHLAVAALSGYIPQLPKVQPPSGALLRDATYAFLPAVEFFLELKASFNKDDGEETVLRKYSGLDVLLLDDIGVEKVTDWSRQIFYTLIDRLYRNNKQVIITSNLSLKKLGETIDDRISSRIIEMCEVIVLSGKDYRV